MRTVIALSGLILVLSCARANVPLSAEQQASIDAELFIAAQSGQAARVADLLARGADPNVSDARGVTPLMHAAGRPSIGPGSGTGTGGGRGGRGGQSAVGGQGFVIPPSQREVVGLLIDAGADVNTQTSDGTAALMMAVLARQTGIVQDLLEAGADPTSANRNGATALRLAATTGDRDVRDRLVLAGAVPDADADVPLGADALAAIRGLLPFPNPGVVPPPPGTNPQGPVRVSGNVVDGQILYRVDPDYPVEARQDRVQGVVILEATIGTDGTVGSLRVVSGPETLRQASIDAVSQWRYAPVMLNGQPVSVTTTVTVSFSLR